MFRPVDFDEEKLRTITIPIPETDLTFTVMWNDTITIQRGKHELAKLQRIARQEDLLPDWRIGTREPGVTITYLDDN